MILPGAKTFVDMIKNKEQVLKVIVEDLDVSSKNMQGFAKLEQLYHEGKDVNVDKVLRSAAKSLRHLNDVNTRVLLLLLIYIGGDNYTADSAKVAIKLGAGDEALREMMRSKFRGV